MSRFLSRRFAGIRPYVPGEQPQDRGYIKLNTNESPFPPAPGVLKALSPDEITRLNLYPDPDARRATERIAARYGLAYENALLGNGSDELLSFCFQAFCDKDTPAYFPNLSYGFYRVFAAVQGVEARAIPLDEKLHIRPEDYAGAEGTIFLANPNAPTGLALTRAQIEGILRANRNRVVVIDEAYVDFGAESCCTLASEYDNLIVVQTMSKSRNLAGARLGYALGDRALIADLNTMKFSFNPYNINRLSLLIGAAAIEDEAYFQRCTGQIVENRGFITEALRARGFDVTDSLANFIFARPAGGMGGGAYYSLLKRHGVLVRHFDDPLICDYVRITVGTREQMQALLDATDRIMAGGAGS